MRKAHTPSRLRLCAKRIRLRGRAFAPRAMRPACLPPPRGRQAGRGAGKRRALLPAKIVAHAESIRDVNDFRRMISDHRNRCNVASVYRFLARVSGNIRFDRSRYFFLFCISDVELRGDRAQRRPRFDFDKSDGFGLGEIGANFGGYDIDFAACVGIIARQNAPISLSEKPNDEIFGASSEDGGRRFYVRTAAFRKSRAAFARRFAPAAFSAARRRVGAGRRKEAAAAIGGIVAGIFACHKNDPSAEQTKPKVCCG